MKEYIVAPAVKNGDEVRIARYCHAELIGYDYFFKGAEQGFVTNMNRFVDRKEALEIAKKNNDNLNKICEGDELYSEDLFETENRLKKENQELIKMVKLMASRIEHNVSDDGVTVRPASTEEKIRLFKNEVRKVKLEKSFYNNEEGCHIPRID